MRKCTLTAFEVEKAKERLYDLLYAHSGALYHQIQLLARQNFYLQSAQRVTVVIDQSFLPNDTALAQCEYCEIVDVYNCTFAQFLASLRKNTDKPLVCDVHLRFIQLALENESTRKVFFIVPRFAIDNLLPRAYIFRLKPRYYTDIKRSELKGVMEALALHPALYQRAYGTDLLRIMHDFYFFGDEQWRMQQLEAVSIYVIKSFLTQTDAAGRTTDYIAELRSDLKKVNFGACRRAKTALVVKNKHEGLTEQMVYHFTARRAFRKVFTYLELSYSDLYARLFITEVISASAQYNESELQTVEVCVRAASWLRDPMPQGGMDVADIFISFDDQSQLSWDLPECLAHLAASTQTTPCAFELQHSNAARDSSISD